MVLEENKIFFVFLVKILKALGILFIMKLHMFQLPYFEREAQDSSRLPVSS